MSLLIAISLASLAQVSIASLCANMQKAGGDENGWVERDADDNLPRTVWKVAKCPRHQDCTPKAWRNANIKSYIHENKCRDYIYKHLLWSGKHGLEEEAARQLCHDVEIECFEESAIDREEYRQDWEKQKIKREKVKQERNSEEVEDDREAQPSSKRSRVGSDVTLVVVEIPYLFDD